MKTTSTVGKLASGAYQQVLRTASLAQPVVRASRLGAVAFGVAAVVIWALWFVPNSFNVLLVLGSVFVLAVLAVPAAIQVAFGAALGEFLEIPERLQGKAAEGAGHASAAAGHAVTVVASKGERRPHLIRLLRSLYDLGRSGFEAKGTLLGVTAVVRLFNPIVLATIFLSVVAGAILVFIAAVGLLVRIL